MSSFPQKNETPARRRGGSSDVLTLIVLVFLPFLWVMLTPAIAGGAQVTLQWDESQEPDVAGYNLYYGTASRSYQHSVDVGSFNSCVISDLVEGVTYYFAATAYDQDSNESEFSSELVYSVPQSDTGGGDPVENDDGGTDSSSTSAAEVDDGGSSSCFVSSSMDSVRRLWFRLSQ